MNETSQKLHPLIRIYRKAKSSLGHARATKVVGKYYRARYAGAADMDVAACPNCGKQPCECNKPSEGDNA